MFYAGNGLQRTGRFACPKLASWSPYHCYLQESWERNVPQDNECTVHALLTEAYTWQLISKHRKGYQNLI